MAGSPASSRRKSISPSSPTAAGAPRCGASTSPIPFTSGAAGRCRVIREGMITLYVQSCSGGSVPARRSRLAHRRARGRQGPHHHGGRHHRAQHGQRARAPGGDAGGGAGQSARIPAGLAHPVSRRAAGERAHAARARAGRGAWRGTRSCRTIPAASGGTFDWIASDLRVAGARRQHAGARPLPARRWRAGSPHARRDRSVQVPGRVRRRPAAGRRSGPCSTRCALRCPQDEAAVCRCVESAGRLRRLGARACAAMQPLLRDALERAWYSARKLITGAEPRPRRK